MEESEREKLRAWAEKMCGPWSGNEHAASAVLDLLDEHKRLRDAVTEFLDYADTHEEGPVINDGYYEGPVCDDSDCGLYWPCPVEDLRRAMASC